MVKPSIIPEGVKKEDAKDAKGKESALPAFAVIPLGTESPSSPAEGQQDVIPVVKRPRKLGLCLCLSAILLTVLLIIGLAFALFAGHHTKYQFRCGVDYDFYEKGGFDGRKPDKTLEEDIEVDPFKGYEQIEIPEQDDFERLTILHDFTLNMTAYRLHFTKVCYITWLDKDTVMGPQEFVERALEDPEFLTKHYETVHETYRVVLPELTTVSRGFGIYIPILCSRVESYWIEKIPVDELEAWEEYWEDRDDDDDDDDHDDHDGHLPRPPRPEHRRRRGATKCSNVVAFDGKVKSVRFCTP